MRGIYWSPFLKAKECGMRSYEEVREFCIRKLAQNLYECVACSHRDRAMLDWLTAERFVASNKKVMDRICDHFYAKTKSMTECAGYETFDSVCGRMVWDSLYQPLRQSLNLPYAFPPHYTHVLFG